MPSPGDYAFTSHGGTLRIDGKAVASTAPANFPAGWHAIELAATLRSNSERIALEWKPPNTTEWTRIPRASLHTHPEIHGLLGRYFDRAIAAPTAAPIDGTPLYTRIDTVLSFFHDELDDRPPSPFAASPSTMEWAGTLDVPEGEPAIRLEATTSAQVFINGKLVLSAQGKRDGEQVQAELAGLSGRVPIVVRNLRPADDWRNWKLRLLWREPGGGWTAFARYYPSEGPDVAAPNDATPVLSGGDGGRSYK